jgi:hypothetical protein
MYGPRDGQCAGYEANGPKADLVTRRHAPRRRSPSSSGGRTSFPAIVQRLLFYKIYITSYMFCIMGFTGGVIMLAPQRFRNDYGAPPQPSAVPCGTPPAWAAPAGAAGRPVRSTVRIVVFIVIKTLLSLLFTKWATERGRDMGVKRSSAIRIKATGGAPHRVHVRGRRRLPLAPLLALPAYRAASSSLDHIGEPIPPFFPLLGPERIFTAPPAAAARC